MKPIGAKTVDCLRSDIYVSASMLLQEESKDKKSGPPGGVLAKEVKLSPNEVSVGALKQLLQRMDNADLLQALDEEEVWEKFTTEEDYPEAFTILARYWTGHLAKDVTRKRVPYISVKQCKFWYSFIVAGTIITELSGMKSTATISWLVLYQALLAVH